MHHQLFRSHSFSYRRLCAFRRKGGDAFEPWVYVLMLLWALAAAVELVVLPIAVYRLARVKQSRTLGGFLCIVPAVAAIALVLGTLAHNIFFGK